METVKEASAIILEAEKRLRTLCGAVLGTGNYDVAMRIADAAKRLAGIADQLAPTNPVAFGQTGSDLARESGRPQSAVRQGTGKKAYPRFLRKGSDIVKIGWSKAERAEYTHKAPIVALQSLIPVLERAATSRRPIAVQDFLPVRAGPGSEEIPAYQIYVWLAWLRDVGLVKQDGRKGLELLAPGALGAAAEKAWTQLEAK